MTKQEFENELKKIVESKLAFEDCEDILKDIFHEAEYDYYLETIDRAEYQERMSCLEDAVQKIKEQYNLEVGKEIVCMADECTFIYGGCENGKHIAYVQEDNNRYAFDKLPTKKDCYVIWVSDYTSD